MFLCKYIFQVCQDIYVKYVKMYIKIFMSNNDREYFKNEKKSKTKKQKRRKQKQKIQKTKKNKKISEKKKKKKIIK